YTLGIGVQPQQTLVNRSSVTWTSLAGTVSGERDSTGGVNDYVAADPTPVSVAVGAAHVEKGIRAPGGLTYAVGELVAYRINFTPGQGTVNGVHLIDALPAGLAYGSVVLSTGNIQRSGGGDVTLLSGPSAGATGSLDFELGDLQSTGADPVVYLDVTARVLDVPGNTNGHTLTNSVYARVVSSTGGVVSIPPVNPLPTITVIEPQLVSGKVLRAGQAAVVGENSTVAYRITVKNTGPGPAYNIQVKDTLPAGLRQTVPVMSSATLDGVSVGLTLNYTPGTGEVVWNLGDAQAIAGAVAGSTRTLVIDYDARTDAGIGGGLTLTNSVYVTQYFSKPGSDLPERRQYAATASSAATVTTPPPAAITKSVNISTATIGETVIYTIRVPSTTVNVALYKLNVLDSIPAGLTVTGVSHNGASLTPGSCGSVSVTNATAGNSLDVTYDCLPPNTQAVIIATGTVRDIAGNQEGGVLTNGASFTWARAAVEASQPAISTAGIVTTLREPVLAITKTLVSSTTADASQGLQAGDKVRYRIKVVNGSGPDVSPAYDLAIRDIADQDLTSPAVIANPDDPGALTDEGTAGGVSTSRWDIAGPLLPGATYQFDVEYTLGIGVQPQQTLVNRSS
ncbi:MAG: hypothetical protein WCK76_14885, partial [Elusimicrobiota bacterium]